MGAPAEKGKGLLADHASLGTLLANLINWIFFPARMTVFLNVCPDNKTIRKSNTDSTRYELPRLISNIKKAKDQPKVPISTFLAQFSHTTRLWKHPFRLFTKHEFKKMKPGLAGAGL